MPNMKADNCTAIHLFLVSFYATRGIRLSICMYQLYNMQSMIYELELV